MSNGTSEHATPTEREPAHHPDVVAAVAAAETIASFLDRAGPGQRAEFAKLVWVRRQELKAQGQPHYPRMALLEHLYFEATEERLKR